MKKILSSIIFCAVLSVPAAIGQNEAKQYNGESGSQIIEAVAKINSGDFKSSASILSKVVEADPENDAAYYYLGWCSLKQNDVESAQEYLKKASELDPKNFWYKYWLANSYYGNDDMMIASYENLLKEFPKKTDIYFSLVNLYLKQHNMDKAMACLEQIETVFGKSEAVTSTKYDILLQQNKPQEAYAELKKYNDEFSSPAILTKMGDFSMAEYKDSAALACYDEAISLDDSYMPAVLGKAEVYRIRRDYFEYFDVLKKFITSEETPTQSKVQYMNMLLQRSEARFIQNFKPQLDTTIDEILELSPKDSSALLLAGRYYYSTDRKDKAKECFKANSEYNPKSASARMYYIQYLWSEKDLDQMEKEIAQARADFPDIQDFVEIQNVVYFNTKNYDGIIQNCKEAIAKNPDDTSITIPAMSTLGDVYHEKGDEKEAFKYYKAVLKLNPDYIPVLNNYAYYLALKGKKLKEACKMSKKTIDKEPDNPTYLDTYGWILHLLGRDEDAKAVFKHAMIYGGKESATTLEHYSIVLDALGEKELSNVYKSQAEKLKAEGKE
jgi:tetratricopeptide (TPR) repeat protein